MTTLFALLLTLAAIGLAFALFWVIEVRRRNRNEDGQQGGWPSWILTAIGFGANVAAMATLLRPCRR